MLSDARSSWAADGIVLLVEDDPAVALALTEALETGGYRVCRVATGGAARGMLGEIRPDVIILDLSLPDTDGLVLCANLKRRTGAPIILSGTDGKREAILGAKLGADLFIVKPLAADELMSHVKAALRVAGRRNGKARTARRDAPPLQIGHLVVDHARRRALLGGETLLLTPTEYRILHALAGRPGEVFSRAELAHLIWDRDDPDIRHSLDVHTRRLRAKLQAGQVPAPAVTTVRGVGYRLDGDRSFDGDSAP